MTVDRTTLGERLMMVRRRRGWSHAVVATGAGISEARLWRIEAGDVWPEPTVLVALCRVMGIDDEAIREEGDEWYHRLKGVGEIAGPHIFDLPTQFDPALKIDGWVQPPPGVRDLTPLPAPPPAPATAPELPFFTRRTARRDCRICRRRPRSFYGLCLECMEGDR